jgi:uncharacterized membrane protein
MESLFYVAIVQAGSISDAPQVSSLLRNILDFLLSIVGIVGILGLVASGSMYLMAAGDMRRVSTAKRAALASVIGLIVVLGSWVIIDQLSVFFS